MRCHKGKITLNYKARLIYQKLLIDAQEEVLLKYISDLTDCGMPLTPQILKNLVIKIIQQLIRQR